MRFVAEVVLMAVLAGCVSRPPVLQADRSPDGRLVARLIRTGDGPTPGGLTLDVGLASGGPFTTIVELSGWTEPFPVRWQGPLAVTARLPCATTAMRGPLQQRIMLPDSKGPIAVDLSRPAQCRLPIVRPS